MNNTKTVDDFIETRVPEKYRFIVEKFRTLIKNEFPELKEEIRGGTEKYYGVPVYRFNKIVLTLSPTKNGITFSFTEGKKFNDRYSLLEGKGNKSLNLRISTIEEFKDEVFRNYVRQAIKNDNHLSS